MAITSRDIERFCQIDGGWDMRQGSNHIVASKRLEDGRRLQVQICHDKGKAFSPGASNRICKQSLGLPGGELQFKDTLRTGVAPERHVIDVPEMEEDLLTERSAGVLIHECQIGRYQLEGLTEADATRIIAAQRFGCTVGAMSPEQLRTAC
jgi:hypothetical protein